MAVVIETTLGDVTVDLFTEQRPLTCLNFLKLCKLKFYNFNLFHSVHHGFIAQTGDPTGEGTGGQSVWGVVEGPEKRYFQGEKMPRIKHTEPGLLSMVATEDGMIGSQFFFTLASDLDSLDTQHCVIGAVTEGHDVLRLLNETICDSDHRPYQDVRITHTVILEDPFHDPKGLREPSRSPSPSAERLAGGRIAPDEELDETKGKTEQEIAEMIQEKEAKARATILEIVGDLPDADMAPPENVLFVCKLNPVTSDDDLEIIFSRFGKIVCCEVIRDKKSGDSLQYAFIEFDNKKSCEDAYFKMDNVLIDDRRIHVDFSQSVSKIKWQGKGRGVIIADGEGKNNQEHQFKNNGRYQNSREIEDKQYKYRKDDRPSRERPLNKLHNDGKKLEERKIDGHHSKDPNRSKEFEKSMRKARESERSPDRRRDRERNIDKAKERERSPRRYERERSPRRREREKSPIRSRRERERTPIKIREITPTKAKERNRNNSKDRERNSYKSSANDRAREKERSRNKSRDCRTPLNSRKEVRTPDLSTERNHSSNRQKEISRSKDIKKVISRDNSIDRDNTQKHDDTDKHKESSSSNKKERSKDAKECNAETNSLNGARLPKSDSKSNSNKKRKEISDDDDQEENQNESPKKKRKLTKDSKNKKSSHKSKKGKESDSSDSSDSSKKRKTKKNSKKKKSASKKRKDSSSSSTSDSSSSESSESSEESSSSSSESDRKKKKRKQSKRSKKNLKKKRSKKDSSSSSSSDSSSSSEEESSSSSSDSDSGHERSRKKSKNKKSVREKSLKKKNKK